VTGTNAYGTGGAASATVNVSAAAAISCTLTANPSTINQGQNSTLTASCPGASSIQWTNPANAPAFSGTGGSGAFNTSGTFVYSVRGWNGFAWGSAASAQVVVQSTACPAGWVWNGAQCAPQYPGVSIGMGCDVGSYWYLASPWNGSSFTMFFQVYTSTTWAKYNETFTWNTSSLSWNASTSNYQSGTFSPAKICDLMNISQAWLQDYSTNWPPQ
jgi:hypothetical protein